MKYLKQHNVFAELGDNVLYQPIKLPNEPKLIKIHNNVKSCGRCYILYARCN